MKFITGIKKYCKENNIEFTILGTKIAPQYRAKKNGKFVDFWANGSFRDTKGKFYRRGASERGYGADNVGFYNYNEDDGCGFLKGIKEEIMSLASDKHALTT